MRSESRFAAAISCALPGLANPDVSVRGLPSHAPVLFQATRRRLADVRVSGVLDGRPISADVAGLRWDPVRADRMSGSVQVSWNTMQSTSGLSLSGHGSHVDATGDIAGRAVELELRLTHTDTSITLTPVGVVLGVMSLPVDRLPAQLRTSPLLQAHTVRPDLPDGSSLTSVVADGAGLRLALSWDAGKLPVAGCT